MVIKWSLPNVVLVVVTVPSFNTVKVVVPLSCTVRAVPPALFIVNRPVRVPPDVCK